MIFGFGEKKAAFLTPAKNLIYRCFVDAILPYS